MHRLLPFLLLLAVTLEAHAQTQVCRQQGRNLVCHQVQKPLSQQYRQAPPNSCQEAQSRLQVINSNMRSGLRASEFEQQKRLRRQYEDMVRRECR